MRRTNPALQRAPLFETAYGRRVTSKTFTILGASTPEIRISTMGASRKMKIGARAQNTSRAGRLCSKCTTLRYGIGTLSLVLPASICQATQPTAGT